MKFNLKKEYITKDIYKKVVYALYKKEIDRKDVYI